MNITTILLKLLTSWNSNPKMTFFLSLHLHFLFSYHKMTMTLNALIKMQPFKLRHQQSSCKSIDMFLNVN